MRDAILTFFEGMLLGGVVLAGMALASTCAEMRPVTPDYPPPIPGDTAAVIAERRLDECLDVLRLCARVTANYEAGATVCRGSR